MNLKDKNNNIIPKESVITFNYIHSEASKERMFATYQEMYNENEPILEQYSIKQEWDGFYIYDELPIYTQDMADIEIISNKKILDIYNTYKELCREHIKDYNGWNRENGGWTRELQSKLEGYYK